MACQEMGEIKASPQAVATSIFKHSVAQAQIAVVGGTGTDPLVLHTLCPAAQGGEMCLRDVVTRPTGTCRNSPVACF